MEEKIIQLAALLHNVGKFWQGAGERGKHAELSRRFIVEHVPEQWQEAASIVSLHHNSPAYRAEEYRALKVIVCADWLSSGERKDLSEEEERGERKKTPLMSIFSEINIGKGTPGPAQYYPIQKLELEKRVIFPNQLEGRGENWLKEGYKKAWEEFVEEVDGIKAITDFDAYFNTLYYMLQKYTWCVPSAVWRSKPDVSLFDHLKTTCAIASCLFDAEERYLDDLISGIEKRWRKEELNEKEESALNAPKFLLIGGDISGVQKFIYRLASPEKAQKGMSKRLRGRSFYLSLLTETFAHYILGELNLTMTNLLWCGGGRLYILSANTDGIVQELERIKRKINKWLLKSFQGDLYLALATVEASSDDIVSFSGLLGSMNYELSTVKNKKYSELFGEENIFGPYGQKEKEKFVGVCSVCGMDVSEWGDERTELCINCANHGRIGQKLPKTAFFVEIATSNPSDFITRDMVISFEDFGIVWFLLESIDELKSLIGEIPKSKYSEVKQMTVYSINNVNHFAGDELISFIRNLGLPISLSFKFVTKTAPYNKSTNSVLDFERIAKFSEGSKLLGALRMDVDDLGAIFSFGLQDNKTMSRFSTLSRMLDLFFAGYLNEICEKYYTFYGLCSKCSEVVKREITVIDEITGSVDRFYEADEDNVCDNCKKKKICKAYITYSGGDDLFIVSSWDDAIKIACDIYDDFREYTCNNPNITLSAGVFTCKPMFPVRRFAKIAGDELNSKSKGYDWNKKVGGYRKDAITVFGETVHWRKPELNAVNPRDKSKNIGFDELFRFAEDLEQEVKNKKLSKSFVYFMDHLKNNELWRPRFAYGFTRNVKDTVITRLDLPHNYPKFRDKIRFPVSWVSLKTRGEKDE
jgi:CRISPR-associated protein Csm1